MENTTILFSVLGLMAFALVAILLIVLWKKGLLTADALNALGDLVDGVILPGDGPIGTLAYYARLAVRAVEQLVKSGQLDTEGDADAIRREKALEIVEEYAAASGPALTDKEISTVRSLIEAEVYALHNPEGKTDLAVETGPYYITPTAVEQCPGPAESGVVQTKDALTISVKKSASRGSAKKNVKEAAADTK